MANSSRPEDALEYYYRALELNPGYIRARWIHLNLFLTRLVTDLTAQGLIWEFLA